MDGKELSSKFLIFKKKFIYLFERERAQAGGAAEEEGEGEGDSPLSKDPDAGLDPRTPGSRPELKADAPLTEPPRHHPSNRIQQK